MASRGGPVVAGSDGTDFHHRQLVASQYQISARNKSRLKVCIFFHILLFVLMMAKLSADILDRLDIFILEIEELEIPKPLVWEYGWCFSLVFIFYGLSALRRNKIRSMQVYVVGTLVFALCPVLFALVYYFSEARQYASTRSTEGIQVWQRLMDFHFQGFPYALLWYAFLVVAVQVHAFSLYFAHSLIAAWKARGNKKLQ